MDDKRLVAPIERIPYSPSQQRLKNPIDSPIGTLVGSYKVGGFITFGRSICTVGRDSARQATAASIIPRNQVDALALHKTSGIPTLGLLAYLLRRWDLGGCQGGLITF